MLKLRDCFKKADSFMGEAGYSMAAGTISVFAAFMMVADRPVTGFTLAVTAVAAAYRADQHGKKPKP